MCARVTLISGIRMDGYNAAKHYYLFPLSRSPDSCVVVTVSSKVRNADSFCGRTRFATRTYVKRRLNVEQIRIEHRIRLTQRDPTLVHGRGCSEGSFTITVFLLPGSVVTQCCGKRKWESARWGLPHLCIDARTIAFNRSHHLVISLV